MKTTIKFLIVIFTALLIGCNNDDDDSITPNTINGYDQGATVNRDFTGVILDTGGNPVSGATVTIGSSSVQTTSKGMFALQNVSVKERFAYVKVTKSGFINGSRTIVPTSGANRVNIMLIPITSTATISTGTNSTVSLPNGTQVKFDGSFKDASGSNYSGNVNVSLYHLKPSDTYLHETMPGSLLATDSNNNAKVLETLGMLHVELTGSGGEKLNIADGHTAEISLEIDATQLATAPNTIPLWSFDETLGIWKEEGSANKVGTKYVGNVAHFSWWNYDAPFDLCTLKTHIEDASGNPISNLRVQLERNTVYNNTGVGYTNGNGDTSGLIPANETLTIKIYDTCGNVIYTSTIGPFNQGTVNTLPTIVLSGSNVTTVKVMGVLKNCSGGNVTNGFAYLKNATAPNSFSSYNMSKPVTNGNFEFFINTCGTSAPPLRFDADDYTTMQTTGPIYFLMNAPVTNLGIIHTCNAANEFITFQVDNNSPVTILNGISAGMMQTNYFNINGQGPNGSISIWNNNSGIPTVGTYSAPTFLFEGTQNGSSYFIGTSTPNTIQFVVSQMSSIGGYIDMSFNGTYTDGSGTHTVTCTVHALRDY